MLQTKSKGHTTKYQITVNLIWSGISGFATYGINLFIIPMLSEQIGIEAYGFIGLADTFISYISLISVALNAFAARYIALYFHKGDYGQANIFYNSVIFSDVLLAVLLLLPCSFIIYRMELLIEIPGNIIGDVKILFILVLLNYLVSILGTAFCAAVFIKNKTNITYRNKAIQAMVFIAVLYLQLYIWKIKVYFLAGAQMIASCVALLLNYYYSRKIVPELKMNMREVSWGSIKKLTASGIWTSFNNMGNILNTGLDLLICNKLLSSVIMGQLSVANQISTLMTGFTMMAVNAFQPKQLEAYAKDDVANLRRLLNISMKLAGIMGSTFFIMFFSMGKKFLELWLPTQDTDSIFHICMVVLMGNIVVVVIRPLFYVYTLTDQLKRIFWITIASGICNVTSMLILIPNTNLGIYAVVGSTMVLGIIVNGSTVFRAARYLHIGQNAFVPVVSRHIFGCLLGAVLFRLVLGNIECGSWAEFIRICSAGGILAAVFSTAVQCVLCPEIRKEMSGVVIHIPRNR